jgi:hypothetical protein
MKSLLNVLFRIKLTSMNALQDLKYLQDPVGFGTAVCIVTELRARLFGFDFRQVQRFLCFCSIEVGSGACQASNLIVAGSSEVTRPGHKATPVPKLKCGARALLPYVFMVWCLMKSMDSLRQYSWERRNGCQTLHNSSAFFHRVLSKVNTRVGICTVVVQTYPINILLPASG